MGESYLSQISDSSGFNGAFEALSRDMIVIAGLIAGLIIAVALFSKNIRNVLTIVLAPINNPEKRENPGSFRFTLRMITLLVSLPLASGILALTYYNLSYWGILILLASLIVIKKFVLEGVSWVSSSRYFSGKTEETTLISFSFFTLALIVLLPIVLLTDWLSGNYAWIYFLCIVGIYLLFYLILFMLQIFKGKFSLFWGFLYLCTLEILPICVLVSLMLKLNI